MLVDARWPPPEPDRPPFRWPGYRWPLLTILFLMAAQFTPPLVAYFCVIASLYCMVESFALLIPGGDGLGKHRQ